ncbi:MAG TPA: type II secretion system secretin GspD [candidate division Zixibacteria bacterium]|nr:type II secretion system secretin GspD [candidate division Zixibacteria bacterium]
MVSLNFNRADLVEIIHILAQHLRLTYTIDPEVKGTVTIHSAEPLRSEDLLPIFHQVLRMNGAVAVRTGNVYRIMPIKEGKGLARPVGQSREDSFSIQVLPVRFFSVAEMKKLLTPFLAPGGEIIDYPRGNFLILVDLPSNIQRLVEIAETIDAQVFAGTRMEIYQPKVASAEELAAEMTKVMQSFAASAPQTENFAAQFIALPRINQLLVISHSEAAWSYAKRWLERIDVVAEGPGRRIFIYPVENGKASELAEVLSQALGQPVVSRGAPPKTLQDLHRSAPAGGMGQSGFQRPGTSGLSTTAPTSTQTQPFGAYATVPAQPGASAQPPAPAVPPGLPRPPTPSAPGAPGARPEEQLRIVPDTATNSLIIYGTAQEFQNIRNILKELDVVPRQVLLETLIAEVTLSDDETFGVDYEILRKGGDVRIFNREFGSRGSILGGILPAPPEGGGLTSFPLGVSGVIGTGSVRAFINALRSDSRVKILSSPAVLATDNRPARIQVGSEEPVATGTITGAVGTVASSTTIQYRNTGRILTIIPQVNSQGLVNLQVLVEVSQRGANVVIGNENDSFPSFDTRQAETTAVVQDGDTLAIGGIIAENKSRERAGVPYLMDIPVLGRFFGTTTDTVRRTELVMLITPHVIRNRNESQQVSESFKNKLSAIRNELERMRAEREREEKKREQLRLEQQRRLEEEKRLKKGEPAASAFPTPQAPGAAPAEESPAAAERAERFPEEPAAAPLEQSARTADGPPIEGRAVAGPSAVSAAVGRRSEPGSSVQSGAKVTSVRAAPQAKRPAPAQPGGNAQARSDQRWVVQVASFALEKEAEIAARKLREKGYDVHVVSAEVGGRTWYRVRVGQPSSRSEALALQETLRSNERIPETYLVLTR